MVSAMQQAARISLFVALLSVAPFSGIRADPAPAATQSDSEAIQQAIQNAPAAKQAGLLIIYQARGFAPVWLNETGLTNEGQKSLAILKAAGEEGLVPGAYAVREQPPAPGGSRALFDLAMTGAVMKYAHDMALGAVDPQTLYDDVELPAREGNPTGALSAAIQNGTAAAFLESLEPPTPAYKTLKAALTRYRDLAAQGPWPQIAQAAKLTAANLKPLADRLSREGYLPAGTSDRAAIETALKTYQRRNGLNPDGTLGQKTVAMLNIGAAMRADQIAANMERWRWLPRDLGERYVMVNVAGGSLSLMENGQETLTSRVVVGTPDKTTPLLAAEAVSVTVNPSWHIPRSILQKEILPKLGRDPGYLKRSRMSWRDGDLIQAPGPGNPLGPLKLEMPNDFGVYLHGTSAKSKFNEDERTFSHGCVRVEAIQALTTKALELGDETQLQKLIAQGQTQSKRLPHKLTVYLQYWTAVPADGTVGFRADSYGRDEPLIARLLPRQMASVN
jgi:murein L,D-transpeptidase YcbB/YkuD